MNWQKYFCFECLLDCCYSGPERTANDRKWLDRKKRGRYASQILARLIWNKEKMREPSCSRGRMAHSGSRNVLELGITRWLQCKLAWALRCSQYWLVSELKIYGRTVACSITYILIRLSLHWLPSSIRSLILPIVRSTMTPEKDEIDNSFSRLYPWVCLGLIRTQLNWSSVSK